MRDDFKCIFGPGGTLEQGGVIRRNRHRRQHIEPRVIVDGRLFALASAKLSRKVKGTVLCIYREVVL